MDAKIKLTNLAKSFGGKQVLKGVSLEVMEGESVVIIGPSGCGKTVLIKLIASLLMPDFGSIIVDNLVISDLKSEKDKTDYIKKISFLFQLNALFDSYPIWKNVVLAKIENEGMKREDAILFAKKMLKMVDLKEDIAFNFPKDISGGMQKRVALARCLTSSPEIIFFDEPTSGLDPVTSIKISYLIKNAKNLNGVPMTKFSIMHDIKCASIVADRIIFLLNGNIEWIGTLPEMYNSENTNLQTFIGKES